MPFEEKKKAVKLHLKLFDLLILYPRTAIYLQPVHGLPYCRLESLADFRAKKVFFTFRAVYWHLTLLSNIRNLAKYIFNINFNVLDHINFIFDICVKFIKFCHKVMGFQAKLSHFSRKSLPKRHMSLKNQKKRNFPPISRLANGSIRIKILCELLKILFKRALEQIFD